MAITTVKPNILKGAIGTLEFGGTDLGATSPKAAVINLAPEYSERFIGQSHYPIAVDFIKGKCTVDVELADVRLANLQVAFNMADANLSGCCLIIDDTVGEGDTLKLVGPGPNSQDRTFYFYDAKVMSQVSYNMGINDDTVLPLQFNCLFDDVTSRIGYIQDTA